MQKLHEWAHRRGYRIVWGPVEEIRAAQAEIRERHADGQLDDDLFRDWLAPYTMNGRPASGLTSVIMIAVPAAAHTVRFEVGERAVKTVMPPTYFRYRQRFEEVRQDLATNVLPDARVEHLIGPHKAVAARLGLVRYGRNNVTYAPGLGSYLQLCGFVTDAELPSAVQGCGGAELLPQCDGCERCLKACPTGAINADRVLINADRCLTSVNEVPGEWQPWIPSRGHSCLVGCMICQRSCPANPKLEVRDSGITFSREETRSLLDDEDSQRSATSISIDRKLAYLGQPRLAPVLGRNLEALLHRAGKDMDGPGPAGTVTSRPGVCGRLRCSGG